MLRPSYTELMEVLNSDDNIDMKVTSRYTIVIAASKRARQLVYGAEPLAYAESDKAVSIAINEIAQGKINISLTGEGVGVSSYLEEEHLEIE